MTTVQIVAIVAIEAVGLFMIVRLWLKAGVSAIRKMILSALLLIPLLGPLMYVFISAGGSEHGEDPGDFSSGGGLGGTGQQVVEAS
jgi:hypothetical protein